MLRPTLIAVLTLLSCGACSGDELLSAAVRAIAGRASGLGLPAVPAA